MDLVVNKLPYIMETVGKARGIGSVVLTKNSLDKKVEIELITLLTSLKNNMALSKSGLDSAYSFNASLKQVINPHFKKFTMIVDNFAKQITKIANNQLTEDPVKFFQEGTDVINSAIAFYDLSNKNLIRLLNIRVNKMETAREEVLIESALFFIVLVFIFFAIYSSISQAVSSIVKQFNKISKNKDLREDISIDVKDELLDIAKAYNNLRKSLCQAMQQIQSGSNSVSLNVAKNSKSADEVAKSAITQVSLIEKSNEITRSVEKSILDASEKSRSSSDILHKSYESLNTMIESLSDTINVIQASSQKSIEMKDQISSVADQTLEIKNILDIIKDIADQTNLLALNAAI
jgi:methyl-accepting chemotaxis protein